MDELTAALDALAAEDLAPLFGPALLERLRPLLAAQNRIAAEVARTVREVSDTQRFALLEALATAVADELDRRFSPERLRVRVRKPEVRPGGLDGTVQVTVTRP